MRRSINVLRGFLLAGLLATNLNLQLKAQTLPVGVPNPGFGLAEAPPVRPNPWTTEIAGYYFVDYTSGTDSGRTYGTPTAPRRTIPRALNAGSYVEVAGRYPHSSGGVNEIVARGTQGPWRAGESGPAWIVGQTTEGDVGFVGSKMVIYGTSLYLKNLRMHSGARIQIGSEAEGYGATNIMVDGCVVVGDSVSRAVGINVTGSLAAGSKRVLLLNNHISRFGDINSSADQDANAMILGPVSSDIWALNNTLELCSGSGVRIGGGPGEAPELGRRIYFAGNVVKNVRQAGIAVKYAADVVISQNLVQDIIDTDWSHSKCIGAQYGPTNVWILYNRVSGARYGVRVASTDSGGDFPIYIIGNVISDIHLDNETYNGGSWDEAGIHVHGGTRRYILNNTLFDVDAGINLSGSQTYTVENNIIANITQNLGNHIFCENAVENTVMRNNLFFQPGQEIRIRLGSRTMSLLEAIANHNKGQGSLVGDPRFVDPTAGRLELLETSPAIDAALSAEALSFNAYGHFAEMFNLSIDVDAISAKRPLTGWDIGAHEFGGSAPRPQAPGNLRILR